jgi:hypothetical protein
MIVNDVETNSSELWAISFFELLLHAHGLHIESHIRHDHREIWCIDEDFQKELEDRYKAIRTPMRRNRSNLTTPRKSISRNGLITSSPGMALKRNLFKSGIPETKSIKIFM